MIPLIIHIFSSLKAFLMLLGLIRLPYRWFVARFERISIFYCVVYFGMGNTWMDTIIIIFLPVSMLFGVGAIHLFRSFSPTLIYTNVSYLVSCKHQVLSMIQTQSIKLQIH